MTLANAIRVLQAHERARQGRVHAYFMRRMKTQTKTTTTTTTTTESKSIAEKNLDESCRVIQTIWRQKYAETCFQRKKIENAQILGMVNELIGREFHSPICSRLYLEETRLQILVNSMREKSKDEIFKNSISKSSTKHRRRSNNKFVVMKKQK